MTFHVFRWCRTGSTLYFHHGHRLRRHVASSISSRAFLINGPRRKQQRRQRSSTPQGPLGAKERTTSSSASVLPVAVTPIMFLLWGISEYLLTNRQLGLNEELRQSFEKEYADHREALDTALPTLFYCVIRRTKGFTHCLSNIQVGDVVEVLEEGVGPNAEYNLCRLPAALNQPHARDTVGWFPIRWLQKLGDYERMIQQNQSR